MNEKRSILKFFRRIDRQNNEENLNIENGISLTESIIKKNSKKNLTGEIIYKLVSNFCYAYEDENIINFADELSRYEDIHAVGILNNDKLVNGIIIKNNFFDLLSKPFARDIYKNKKLADVAEETKTFFEDISILTLAEQLKEELREFDNNYYILTNRNNEFSGIFSTKSILIYLSDITQKDLELADKLQKRIVNEDEYINKNNIEFASASKMAKEVGGDFYIIKEYKEKTWLVSIFDISGKGISASLLTSLLGGMYSIYDFNKGIKFFAKKLNEFVYFTFKLEKYLTGIIATYNEITGEIILLDCGHSYIYLFRNNKLLKLKTSFNLPLGIEENYKVMLNKIKLLKNDILLLITDGLVEQTDINGNTYTLKNIDAIIKKEADKSLKDLKNKIIEDIHNFKKNQYQHDDITFILMKNK